MTIAWAARCVDGVVIASDSMRVVNHRTFGFRAHLTSDKLMTIGQRFAYVISGSFDSSPPPYGSGLRVTDSLEVLAAGLFRELGRRRLIRHPRDENGGLSDLDHYELLIAGGQAGSTPEVLWLRSDPERVERLPLGGFVVAACLGYRVAKQMKRHAGLTTAQAIAMGARRSDTYVRSLYRSYGRKRLEDFSGVLGHKAGPIPPVAFPLNVAVITADDIRGYQVRRPGDLTEEDLERARARLAAQERVEPAGLPQPASSALDAKEELRDQYADTPTATG